MKIWQTIVWNWQNLVWTWQVIGCAVLAFCVLCCVQLVIFTLRNLSVQNYDWDTFYSWHEPTVRVEWDQLITYPGEIYTYSQMQIPLDPKIHANYRQLDQNHGIVIIRRTEEFIGSEELRGPIVNAFVDLGTDGIAVIDLMKYCPVGFIPPKSCKTVELNDGHFLAPTGQIR